LLLIVGRRNVKQGNGYGVFAALALDFAATVTTEVAIDGSNAHFGEFVSWKFVKRQD
jgi:hypothetical protein